jgi:Family of unknown function (DUF6641)
MAVMTKLKLTNEQRTHETKTTEDKLRAKVLERLAEQLELAEAELAGTTIVKMRKAYVVDDNGERVALDVERRLRKWFWRNEKGVWFIELRYSNKAIKIDGAKTAIEVGDLNKLGSVIAMLIDAVKAGELDDRLLAAKTERVAKARKKNK